MSVNAAIRGVLAAGVALVAACQSIPGSQPAGSPPDYWPTRGWRSTTPEQQGIDSEKLADALDFVRARGIAMHSLLIVRNGYVVLDATVHPFREGQPHDLASVTKSVTATLVGVAIARQAIADVRQPVVSFFPGRTIANRDPRKERLAISHLLTMTSGLDCRFRPHEKTLQDMRRSADWVGFMLDLPMAHEPGESYEYCSGGMHLLSGVISQATGASALAFAQRELFAPLGIERADWPADSGGVTHGWGDLHLDPRDAAKIGLLWLHRGRWEGREIVDARWMREATRVHAKAGWGDEYGYGLWIHPGRGLFEGNGRGGQRLSVLPSKNLVVVFTGGGFEPGEVGNLLALALKSDGPLPENRAGGARLAAAVAAAARPPAPQAARPLPAIAKTVSGKAYELDANPLGLKGIAFTFAQAAEASVRITNADGRVAVRPAGLDGVARLSPGGRFDLPVALKGSWEEGPVFVLDYDEVANINHFRVRARFEADRVRLDVRELTTGAETAIEGRERPT